MTAAVWLRSFRLSVRYLAMALFRLIASMMCLSAAKVSTYVTTKQVFSSPNPGDRNSIMLQRDVDSMADLKARFDMEVDGGHMQ